MLDAVVLAGGPLDAVARLQPGAPNKAFVEVGGVALVGRVVSALRGSSRIRKIIAVAPLSEAGHSALSQADEVRPDGVHITESLRNGLRGLDGSTDALVVASDLPVLTAAAVDDFAARVVALDADLAYGCVEKRVHLRHYPDVPHTWARLRDGTFCGGGLFGMKPRVLPLLERFIEQLGAARKQPFRLASLFGWDMLVRYALGRLTIAQAEDRAKELLGAPARAAISPYPETAVNVDRVSDVELARQLLR